jgi:hypothetical protein
MSEQASNPTSAYTVPSVSIITARTGASSKANALGMRAMQERAYAKRGEQYLLIKSPPASGKSRALMFIALDKLNNQGLRQAIIVVPERSIGGSFADEPLSQHGFYWDWQVAPQWNLCNAPGVDEPRLAKSKVDAVRKFLESTGKALLHPCHLPLCGGRVGCPSVRQPLDCHRRVPPRLQQPGQQAG